MDPEIKVFFKLKGDYDINRNLLLAKIWMMLIRKLKGYIKKLTKLANKEIPITNSTRLGLALNYSIFIMKLRD